MGKRKELTENRRLSKMMKYGGLGKLKWFCDVCKFQARSAEAFRAHTQSEHHRLMMAQFRPDQKSIIQHNSEEFKNQFLNLLKRKYVNREVLANIVYVQVISDKNHQHMNSTRWESVRGFCSEMADKGIIEMRMTERGPVIKYVEKDPASEAALRLTKEVEEQFQRDLARDEKMVEEMMKNMPEMKWDDEIKEEQSVDVQITTETKPIQKKVSSLFGGSTRPKKPPPT